MTLERTRDLLSAISLVAFPLLFMVYWFLYPAYGLLDPGAALHAIEADPTRTSIGNGFALAGTLLAVPATFALMRVLVPASRRVALIGGFTAAVGWIALVGLLMVDPVAVQIVHQGKVTPAAVELFSHIMTSPAMLVVTILATFHVVGGTLLGVALLRSRLVPSWAAVAAIVAPPIHLASNIAGLLWVDAATWIALSIVQAFVARIVLRPEPAASARAAPSEWSAAAAP